MQKRGRDAPGKTADTAAGLLKVAPLGVPSLGAKIKQLGIATVKLMI